MIIATLASCGGLRFVDDDGCKTKVFDRELNQQVWYPMNANAFNKTYGHNTRYKVLLQRCNGQPDKIYETFFRQ